MNDQLEKQLLELVTWLTNTIQSTGGLAAEQLPGIVRELLVFNTVRLIFFVVAGMLFLYSAWPLSKWVRRNMARELVPEDAELHYSFNSKIKPTIFLDEDGDATWLVAPAVSVSLGYCTAWLATLIMFPGKIIELIEITIAPRIWLLEYAADLIK